MTPLPPDLAYVIDRYRQGDFPMAARREDADYDWYNPAIRGILPLDALMITPELEQVIRDRVYDIRINHDFDRMIATCASRTDVREETWINSGIEELFRRLHRAGRAYSVECWQDGTMAGGLYGLHPGGAVFCGESMVSLKPRASAVALVHLCARLWAGGFLLLDCQMVTPHTARLGAFEIPQHTYLSLLHVALGQEARLDTGPVEMGLIDDFLAHCRASVNY